MYLFQDPKKQGTKGKHRSSSLLRKYLKPSAFPSVFPGLPSHYQKEVPAQRSAETSSSARRARVVERHEAAAEEFLATDKVNRFVNVDRRGEDGPPPAPLFLPSFLS